MDTNEEGASCGGVMVSCNTCCSNIYMRLAC